jgi:oxygen-independent coproporphyrinogen-3 oxidase
LFAARPPPLPDEDLAWAMQGECQALLAAHGFAQYEVSAYARAGRQCRHNLNYWSFGDYLGAGAGAHGKLTEAPQESAQWQIMRSTHLREPRRYFGAAAGGPEWRVVPASDLPFEFMMNALRLTDGFAGDLWAERTGLPPGAIAARLQHLAATGLLHSDGVRWRATSRGFQFLNEVISRFLPDPNSQSVARS